MWYQKFGMYIQGFGFVRSWLDNCVYNSKFNDHFIYVVLYVDDMLFVKNNLDLVKEVKLQLFSNFGMKDLEVSHFILRIKIKRDQIARKISLNQIKYVEIFLKCFKM